MAQTPQPDETGEAGDTAGNGSGRPQGLFGTSTTILLLIFAVAAFWWSRRRRVEMEEQLRAQRREAEASAERSALDVAHLMRSAPHPGARAAATEGLASAAPVPSGPEPESTGGATAEARTTLQDDTPVSGQTPLVGGQSESLARDMERAEARAVAERVAEEQAEQASRAAQTTGESLVRRADAASSAAEEATADTADAENMALIGDLQEGSAVESLTVSDSQSKTDERIGDTAVPMGAIAGNGTATCPPGYPIKGNRQSRIYHRPGQVSYSATVAEYCFASEAAAESAGFRQSRARDQRTQS